MKVTLGLCFSLVLLGAGFLAIPAAQAGGCPAGDSTCLGSHPPPPGERSSKLQPYVRPHSKSGVVQPVQASPRDVKITGAKSSCYALGKRKSDYIDTGSPSGYRVAVCSRGFVLAGKYAPVKTHTETCATGSYEVWGYEGCKMPVVNPTVKKCGGGKVRKYQGCHREDIAYGCRVGNPPRYIIGVYVCNVAKTKTRTTTSPVLSEASLMCCPITNSTTPPAGG